MIKPFLSAPAMLFSALMLMHKAAFPVPLFCAVETVTMPKAVPIIVAALIMFFYLCASLSFLVGLVLVLRALHNDHQKKRQDIVNRLRADENALANATEREKRILRDDDLSRAISKTIDGLRPTPESKLTSFRQYSREIDPGFNEQRLISLAKKTLVDFRNLPATKDITPFVRNVTPAMLEKCKETVREAEDVSFETFAVLDADIRGYYREDGRDVMVVELKTREGKRLKDPDPDDSPVSIEYYEVAAVRASGQVTREDPLTDTDKCGNCGSPLALDGDGNCSFCGAAPKPREDEWAVDSVRKVAWVFSSDERDPYKIQQKDKSEKSIQRRKKLKSLSPWILTVLILASFFVPAIALFISKKTGKEFITPVIIFGIMGAWLIYGIIKINIRDHRQAAKPTPQRMLSPIKDYIAKVDPGFDAEATLKEFTDLLAEISTGDRAAALERRSDKLSDEVLRQLKGQLDYVYIVNNIKMRVYGAELKRAVMRGWFRDDGLDHLVMEFEAELDLRHGSGYGAHVKRRVVSEWDVARTTGVVTGWSPERTLSCPNCGAEVTVRKSGKCPYCDHVVTVNEHDWMLYGMRELDLRSKKRKDAVRSPQSDTGRSQHE